MGIWIMIICIVIAVWAIFPPGPGKMPLFYDNNGKIAAAPLATAKAAEPPSSAAILFSNTSCVEFVSLP